MPTDAKHMFEDAKHMFEVALNEQHDQSMIKPDSVAKHGIDRQSNTCLAGADITSASTFESRSIDN